MKKTAKTFICTLLSFSLVFSQALLALAETALPQVAPCEIEEYYIEKYNELYQKYAKNLEGQELYAAEHMSDAIGFLDLNESYLYRHEILNAKSLEDIKQIINRGFFGEIISQEDNQHILKRFEDIIQSAGLKAPTNYFFQLNNKGENKERKIRVIAQLPNVENDIIAIFYGDDLKLAKLCSVDTDLQEKMSKYRALTSEEMEKTNYKAKEFAIAMGYMPYITSLLANESFIAPYAINIDNNEIANVLLYSIQNVESIEPELISLYINIKTQEVYGAYDYYMQSFEFPDNTVIN